VRVIAGEAKGHGLNAPPGRRVRPTSDRVREALFNILVPDVVGATFLDAYAGVGAVGIEALSRGAKSCDFIEADKGLRRYLRTNLEHTGLAGRGRIYLQSVERFVAGWGGRDTPYDIVFADPPYACDPDETAALLRPLVAGLLVYESPKTKGPEPGFDAYHVVDKREYGGTRLYFLRPRGDGNEAKALLSTDSPDHRP